MSMTEIKSWPRDERYWLSEDGRIIGPRGNALKGSFVGEYLRVSTAQGRHMYHRMVVECSLGRRLSGDEEVDHINGIPQDNRVCNLRVTTRRLNNMNRSEKIKGWTRVNGNLARPFRAYINSGGKQKTIGYYATAEEAHSAYLAERTKILPGADDMDTGRN